MKGYKTLFVSAGLAIVGALQGLDWATFINNPQTAGWVITGIGMVMAILRLLTTSPVGEKS